MDLKEQFELLTKELKEYRAKAEEQQKQYGTMSAELSEPKSIAFKADRCYRRKDGRAPCRSDGGSGFLAQSV